MHKKDLLQRQFEEFGKVLAQILGYKSQNDWEKFQQSIAEAAKKFTGADLDEIDKLTEEAFETKYILSNDLTQEQKKILATIFFEKMNVYLLQDNEQAYAKLKGRCLKLYQHLMNNFTTNEFDLDVHYKIDILSRN